MMDTVELLKKVRHIEIKSRGLTNHIFAGQYHSAFKGKGMTFSEVREYQYGDSIRDVDWNVTARFNHPYIKVYEEERELTVMLLIDMSQSGYFGTQKQMKRDLMVEVSAVLAFSAITNNDKIGAIFFTDKVEKFIPPKKGRKHILRIITEMLDYKPESAKTNIATALEYFNNAIKRRCIAFVISDFIDHGFDTAIRIANSRHDVVALQIIDQRELELPDVGFLHIRDAETGEMTWIDTSKKAVRESYRQYWNINQQNLGQVFSKAGIDYAVINTGGDYVKPLLNLFKHR